jgi:hypothetical protein
MSGGSGDLNSLHLLPDKMKTEIALHVHLETLKKANLLSCVVELYRCCEVLTL